MGNKVKKVIKKPNVFFSALNPWPYTIAILFFAIAGAVLNWKRVSESFSELKHLLFENETVVQSFHVTKTKLPPNLIPSLNSFQIGKIASINWSSENDFLLEIAQNNRPVLIKNSPVTRWGMREWDLKQLATSGLLLNWTKWQLTPLFVLGNEREKGGMIGSPQDHPLMYTNVSLADFLYTTMTKDTFFYWSGDLDILETAMKKRIEEREVEDDRDHKVSDESDSTQPKTTHTFSGKEIPGTNWEQLKV